MNLVAVTGATGLVGNSLVSYLDASGYKVVAVGRSPEKLSRIVGKNISTKVADVSSPEALEAAFEGCDAVVHAAGSVDPYGNRDDIFATNYGGTKNALEAAVAKNVKHFLHVSSLSVITGQGDQYNVDETAPLKPCGEAYADSKVEAESYVMGFKDTGDIKVTALRPGFIYGPGERAWLPRVINSIATGKAMLIDGGFKECNVIFVENLSKAIESAILNEKAFGQVYNLTDGQKVTKKQLFDTIAEGMNLPKVTKKIPSSIARLACQTISAIAPYLPLENQKTLSRFSKAAYRLAGVNQGFSIVKAEKELNYINRISFEEGMKKTLATFERDRQEALIN